MNKVIFLKIMFLLLVILDSTAMDALRKRDTLYKKEIEDITSKIKKMGVWPDVEITEDTPLDEEIVTNCSPFLRKIKQNTIDSGSLSEQDEKAIQEVCLACGNFVRHVRRFHLAAALYLSVNPEHEWVQDVLYQVVTYNDLPLVALALNKGIDANFERVYGPVIFKARTVAMAELLRNHGANVNVANYRNSTVLHSVNRDVSEHALIPYYISYGVDPLQRNSAHMTAIDLGIRWGQDTINRLVVFLEAGVSQNDIVAAGQANQGNFPESPSVVKEAIELYHKNKARIK